jgi:hypothetical protein
MPTHPKTGLNTLVTTAEVAHPHRHVLAVQIVGEDPGLVARVDFLG